jgi:hypothetical protein
MNPRNWTPNTWGIIVFVIVLALTVDWSSL